AVVRTRYCSFGSTFVFVSRTPFFFCFPVPAPSEISTLSLHDALPISACRRACRAPTAPPCRRRAGPAPARRPATCGSTCCACSRSEEHTSELQSPYDIVCRLLLEKKKKKTNLRRILLKMNPQMPTQPN